MQSDAYYMRRCFALARRGLTSCSPNPAVGALLVCNDKIIGRGWHIEAGEAHAEVMAIDSAICSFENATLYVSLEPCNHTGRTPPCTEKILACGISRVVYSVSDPNKNVLGGGGSFLAEKGLEVKHSVLECEGKSLIESWLFQQVRQRAQRTLLAAFSLDGQILPFTMLMDSDAMFQAWFKRTSKLLAVEGDKPSSELLVLDRESHLSYLQDRSYDRLLAFRSFSDISPLSVRGELTFDETDHELVSARRFRNASVSVYSRATD